MSNDGPYLIGRDCLTQLQPDWTAIHQLYSDELQAVLDHHSAVFKVELKKLHIDAAV